MNIMSCVISYILISFVELTRVKCSFISLLPNNAIINSCVAIIGGTIFALLFALVFCSNWFSKITVKLFNKTPNEDIWRDILDLKKGSNLKLYIKDADYYIIGHHKNHEEKNNDGWIAVSAFAKFNKNTNENYNNEPSFLDDDSVIYTVRFSDIEHIEVF